MFFRSEFLRFGSETIYDHFDRHLDHPIPEGRNAQRALTAVGLGYPYPAYRLSPVRLAFQLLLKASQKTLCPFSCLDVLEGLPVNSGRPLVGSNKRIGMTQNVSPTELVVQGVEAKARLLLGLGVKLPLECPDLYRG